MSQQTSHIHERPIIVLNGTISGPLAGGTITNTFPTDPGRRYGFSFDYRGPTSLVGGAVKHL